MPSPFRRIAHGLARRAAPRIPLALYRRLAPRTPLGFFYHAVSDEPLPHVRRLYPHKTSREFEADLGWLSANTRPIAYPELKAHLETGRPLPPAASYLSFDDGMVECFTVARPLLLKYSIPAVFFLTTDWIDNRDLFYRSKVSLILEALYALPPAGQADHIHAIAREHGLEPALQAVVDWLLDLPPSQSAAIDRICSLVGVDPAQFLAARAPYLTGAQIRTMQAEGFVFGAHSRRHAKLAGLPPEEQQAEILESCRIVADLTGADQAPFAFPFSGDRVSRAMLFELRRTHAVIGPIFDTRKLRQEPGIFHRIWADKPVPGLAPQDNLAHWLHDAYQRLVVERTL